MTVPSHELMGTVTAESGVNGQPALDETQVPGRARVVWRRFRHQKTALAGLVLVFLLVLMAFVGIHLTHWTYTGHDFNALQTGPTTSYLRLTALDCWRTGTMSIQA